MHELVKDKTVDMTKVYGFLDFAKFVTKHQNYLVIYIERLSILNNYKVKTSHQSSDNSKKLSFFIFSIKFSILISLVQKPFDTCLQNNPTMYLINR